MTAVVNRSLFYHGVTAKFDMAGIQATVQYAAVVVIIFSMEQILPRVYNSQYEILSLPVQFGVGKGNASPHRDRSLHLALPTVYVYNYNT